MAKSKPVQVATPLPETVLPPKEGWFRALGIKCPVCCAAEHDSCEMLYPPYKKLSVTQPHHARIMRSEPRNQ